MKQSLVVSVLAVFILAFLVSCTPMETGDILFSFPSYGQVFRDDDLGSGSQSVPVVVSSTYETEKIVRFFLDNNQTEIVVCIVEAYAVDQICPSMPLQAPGDHTITAKVGHFDGSVGISQVGFSWKPYAPLDKTMYYWSFNDSPVGGYLLMYVVIILIVSILVAFITKDWVPVLVWDSVVTAMIVATLFFLPSAGPAQLTNCWLGPLLLILGSAALAMGRYPRPTLVAHRDDGSQIRYLSRPRNKRADKKLVIDVRDINAELVVDEKFLKKSGGNDGPEAVNQTVDNDSGG